MRVLFGHPSNLQTVVIVDTSNEIAGDGNIPHQEAIGESRRIMVPVKADQHKYLLRLDEFTIAVCPPIASLNFEYPTVCLVPIVGWSVIN